MEQFKKSGAEILVTGCSDCYHAFKVLYDKFGLKGDLEVLHTTEYLDRLIKTGKLKPTKKVATRVTYHDPCQLGALPGAGKGTASDIDSYQRLKLIEADWTREEWATCCGGGGGFETPAAGDPLDGLGDLLAAPGLLLRAWRSRRWSPRSAR
jgi:Fe-S oxidoreductase